jgi:hypothetical protein
MNLIHSSIYKVTTLKPLPEPLAPTPENIQRLQTDLQIATRERATLNRSLYPREHHEYQHYIDHLNAERTRLQSKLPQSEIPVLPPITDRQFSISCVRQDGCCSS